MSEDDDDDEEESEQINNEVKEGLLVLRKPADLIEENRPDETNLIDRFMEEDEYRCVILINIHFFALNEFLKKLTRSTTMVLL